MKKRISFLGSRSVGGIIPYVGVVLILCIWSIVAASGVASKLLIPSPLRVIASIKDVGFTLLLHIGATLFRVIAGYTIGVVLGITIGMVMQYSNKIYSVLDGIVETFRPIPPVALIPFIILIFGFSEFGKLFIVTLGVWVLITVATVEAIERVSPSLVRFGLVVGLTRKELFRRIIVPSAWPEMRSGFRIALALAISLVVVSEFMGAKYGLGYLISVSKVTLTTPTILLCIFILGWIGWGLDRLLRFIFDRTTAWDIRAKGAIR